MREVRGYEVAVPLGRWAGRSWGQQAEVLATANEYARAFILGEARDRGWTMLDLPSMGALDVDETTGRAVLRLPVKVLVHDHHAATWSAS